jgi:hypothetical protein
MIRRLVAYAHHFSRASKHLDLRTLFRLFILRCDFPKPLPARVRNGSGTFWYRGFKDRGVLSHFYQEGSFQNFFRALERADFAANCFICGENLVAVRKRSGISLSRSLGTDL